MAAPVVPYGARRYECAETSYDARGWHRMPPSAPPAPYGERIWLPMTAPVAPYKSLGRALRREEARGPTS